jgi:hypothetical protein
MTVAKNQAWASRAGIMKQLFKAAFDKKKIVGMEIGVWYGKGSTQIWLKNLAPESVFTLIDSWKPYASKQDLIDDPFGPYAEMDALASDAFISAFSEVKRIERERAKDNLTVNLLRANSSEYLKHLLDDSFDFIYIDGDHKYVNVKSDIREAKRLIKKDFGIICGDDLENIPSKELYEIAKQHVLRDFLREPNLAFHPGVLSAVYEEFNEVNMLNGFWWIVICDGEYRPDVFRPTMFDIPPPPPATMSPSSFIIKFSKIFIPKLFQRFFRGFLQRLRRLKINFRRYVIAKLLDI